MVRVISVLATVCFIAAFVVGINGGKSGLAIGLVLLLISLALGGFLLARRVFFRVREIVSAVRTFTTGDVRHARIVDVGEPEGLFGPTAETTLEVEGDDGQVHRLQVEMPVPFPAAMGYRLAHRFNVPIIGRKPLSELMALELKREGLKLSAGWRPAPDAEVIEVGRIDPTLSRS